MGAAGGVTIYRLSDIEKTYAEMWPDHDLREDWRYLDTITVDLDGEKWVLDYADDQGMHEGTGNAFWFGGGEMPEDEVPDDLRWHVEINTYYERREERTDPLVPRGRFAVGGQVRVFAVLNALPEKPRHVEVWT